MYFGIASSPSSEQIFADGKLSRNASTSASTYIEPATVVPRKKQRPTEPPNSGPNAREIR